MKTTPDEHIRFMREAYKEAVKAYEAGEIPIGAVVVCGNRIIARAHNQTETLRDVTAHAEMLALTAAAHVLGSKYLVDCSLYVTVEPCVMCGGAAYWAQLQQVIYGAPEPKRGYSVLSASILHPKTAVVTGVMQADCEALMKNFFAQLRK